MRGDEKISVEDGDGVVRKHLFIRLLVLFKLVLVDSKIDRRSSDINRGPLPRFFSTDSHIFNPLISRER